MKQFKMAALVLALLVFGATAMQAADITINDLGDGGPGFSTSGDINITGGAQAPESLTLNGIFHIPFGNGVVCDGNAACDQRFNLLEASGAVSDTLELTFNGPGGPVGPDWQEDFTLVFLSDSEGPLAGLPGGVDILEDGTFQALPIDQGFLRGSSFSIHLASDVTDTPEPASLALVGFGLIGLGIARRRKA